MGVSWSLLDASLAISGVLLAAFWLVLASLGCILAIRELPHVDVKYFSEDLGKFSWPFGSRFGHRWIDIEYVFVHETQTCFHLRFFSSLKCGRYMTPECNW